MLRDRRFPERFRLWRPRVPMTSTSMRHSQGMIGTVICGLVHQNLLRIRQNIGMTLWHGMDQVIKRVSWSCRHRTTDRHMRHIWYMGFLSEWMPLSPNQSAVFGPNIMRLPGYALILSKLIGCHDWLDIMKWRVSECVAIWTERSCVGSFFYPSNQSFRIFSKG